MDHRTVIAARNVRKAFAGVVVLEDATFDGAGEVHTLAGENGAGKSTLMKILSGALRPDARSKYIVCLVALSEFLIVSFEAKPTPCRP